MLRWNLFFLQCRSMNLASAAWTDLEQDCSLVYVQCCKCMKWYNFLIVRLRKQWLENHKANWKWKEKKQEAEIIQVFVFADTYTPLWEFLICKEWNFLWLYNHMLSNCLLFSNCKWVTQMKKSFARAEEPITWPPCL